MSLSNLADATGVSLDWLAGREGAQRDFPPTTNVQELKWREIAHQLRGVVAAADPNVAAANALKDIVKQLEVLPENKGGVERSKGRKNNDIQIPELLGNLIESGGGSRQR